MAIPNCQHIVAQLAGEYSVEWREAHTSSPNAEKFIRRLAWVLHSTVDPRFGLNGKRGTSTLSQDAINWIGEGPGNDPATGKAVTVIDVIGGAGGPNPTPAWQAFSDLPGPGAWIKPTAVDGGVSGGGGTPLPAPPAPVPAVDLKPLLAAVAALSAKVDALGAIVIEARDAATSARAEAEQAKINASDVKHVSIPALQASIGPMSAPVYTGRIFGQNVTLTPKG